MAVSSGDYSASNFTGSAHHPLCARKARNKRLKLALIFWRVFLCDIATKFLGTSATRKTGLNEKPGQCLQSGLSAGACLSDCHLKKQRLINSLEAEVEESADLLHRPQTTPPYNISCFHRGSHLACKALTVAALSCILILTGTSSWAGVTAMSLETYTRVLMDASPEFPMHFLKSIGWHNGSGAGSR